MADGGVHSGTSGCFIAFRNDRLGGRLNAILTAMRLSQAYGARLRIFWALTEASSAELHCPGDLFSQEFMDAYFIGRADGAATLRKATDIIDIAPGTTRQIFEQSLENGGIYLCNAATEQLLLPWEQRDDLICLPDLIASIGFSQRVREMIATIDARLNGLAFRSYHLRRGDIIQDSTLASHNLWPSKYIPRVIYEWHMKRELAQGDGLLVVFSDARQEAAAFSALSPRVMSFDDLIGGEDLTPLQRDFLELYTMSRSEAIFAPPHSAFSGLAAVIGNKSVTDIEASLTPAERAEALDELVRRLESQPEVFLGQADAGQNFPFIAPHLDAQDKAGRMNDIVMRHIGDGMDRAYAFSFLSERLLAAGEYGQLDGLIELMRQRDCYREEHWSTALLHGAIADMVRGRWDSAMSRYISGSWFAPLNRLATETFQYLVSTGRYDALDNYPYDPDLLRQTGRIFGDKHIQACRQLMQRATRDGVETLSYPADMHVRDWRRIHGKKLSFRFMNKAKVLQQAQGLGRLLERNPGSAALNSAVGRLLLDAGEFAAAERHLQTALDIMPENPLYQKRLSDLLHGTDRSEQALTILTAACQASGDHPCYLAELGQLQMEMRRPVLYAQTMRRLYEKGTRLIEPRLLVAEAMRRDKNQLPDLIPFLQDLQNDALGSYRVLALQSRVSEQLGRWTEALAQIMHMHVVGRPPAMIRMRLSGLARAYMRHYDAQATRRLLLENNVPEDLLPDEVQVG